MAAVVSADDEGSYQPKSSAARQTGCTGQQGPGKIAQKVGRGDQPGLGLRQTQRLRHHRQDWRIDETADAHRGRERDQATERQRHRIVLPQRPLLRINDDGT
jgi:hypothetical protein